MTPDTDGLVPSESTAAESRKSTAPGEPCQIEWRVAQSCRKCSWTVVVICLGLAALVLIVFGQTFQFGFINRDDADYVYGNPVILKGLSLSNIEWAFTHVVSGHWHPLTVILLMLEAGFFGNWPGGYHLVNVALHATAAVLLFLMLLEMTGTLWRSAFVAAVFAIHPLRAESVAWIAECKDVLSGVFFMLTLWAYVRYARGCRPKVSYSMMLVWFALGSMSKPMLVTVPCVLLLLDYWPLGRLRKLSEFPRLLLEKLPLFAISGLSSMATVFALKVGNPQISTYPANAPIGYVAYLWKLIYPANLAAMYPPEKGGFAPWMVFNAIVLLAGLTLAVYLWRKKHPYLIVGWFWYLGMLVPVSGLMQTGEQIYADRYTYLPAIGLCIAVTWMAADLTRQWRFRRIGLGVAGVAIPCALMAACWRQTGYWRDSITLWRHAIECGQGGNVAYNGLGEALFQQGRTEEAIEAFQGTGNEIVLDSAGDVLLGQGRTEEAIAHFRAALRLDPDDAVAHCELGAAYTRLGRPQEAAREYDAGIKVIREWVEANPGNVQSHNNLGYALLQRGRLDEAIAECRAALAITPNLPLARENIAVALMREGRTGEAIAEYRSGLELSPNDLRLQNFLAWILATARDPQFRNGADALKIATAANQEAGGNDPGVLRTLAAAYAATGDFSNAVETAQKALELAAAQSNASLADTLRGEIQGYRNGRQIDNRK